MFLVILGYYEVLNTVRVFCVDNNVGDGIGNKV